MKIPRHWLWIMLLLPLIGLGLARLRLDVEVLNLLPQRSPVVQGLKLYQEHFANARELIVAVEAPSAAAAENAAQMLAESWRRRSEDVQRVTWQPPWLESPAQAAEFVAYLWLNQPPDVFSNLLERLQGQPLHDALAEARLRLATSFSPQELAVLGYDPLQLTVLPEELENRAFGSGEALFASSNGTFRVLFVEAGRDLSGYKACTSWLHRMQAEETNLRRNGQLSPDVTVRYTGRPAFVSEIAGGMERDMNASIAGTLVIISLLFYLFHRRWKPLVWLITLLLLILAVTMSLGALIFGTLSVISLGFAAILLGLSVDYGLVLYQEAQSLPRSTAAELRRLLAPSILWSATTTAAAFALLNLSSLPGLAQLGTLVAVGVLVGSAVMITVFLPPLIRTTNSGENVRTPSPEPGAKDSRAGLCWAGVATAVLVLGSAILAWNLPPRFDHTADALRPVDSPAYATVESIKEALGRPQEPLWVLISGNTTDEVGRVLQETESVLHQARAAGLVQQYTLPTRIWPERTRQRLNAASFVSRQVSMDELRAAFVEEGFSDASFALTERFLSTWQAAGEVPPDGIFWPTNDISQWILGQTTARTATEAIAMGLVHTASPVPTPEPVLENLRIRLAEVGAALSGWELLGPSMFRAVEKELTRVLLPMSGMLIICLGLAFRRWAGVALSLSTIAVSAGGLFVIMQAMGWSWNLMNLMALPLLLGAGVDYSIHIQLAMQRHGGRAARVRQTTGRALLLCAATTATGFGTLGLSSNAGLASLGQVCAAGLVSCYLTSVYLLPAWWRWTQGRSHLTGKGPSLESPRPGSP